MNFSILFCAHIGFHKTASTWMQLHAFSLHPDILFLNSINSEFEEKWFKYVVDCDDFSFNKREIERSVNEMLELAPINKNVALISSESLSGHIYTGYNACRNAERIFELFGKCKVFIVIRNQVDYIRSAYFNYVNHGGALSIDNWLNDSNIPGRLIFQKLKYHKLIKYYMDLFGKENIYVKPYESMVEDATKFMNEFFEFLGIKTIAPEYIEKIRSKKVYKSYSPLMVRIARMINGIHGGGTVSRRKILLGIDRLLFQKISFQKDMLSYDQISTINNYFKTSNLKTLKIIDTDIRKFNYSC